MPTTSKTAQIQDIDRIFDLQVAHKPYLAKTTAPERKEKLKRILKYLSREDKVDALCEALYQDFRKPRAEVLLSEVSVVMQHIRYILPRLKRWMAVHPRKGGLANIGTRSYIHPDPKGNVLIIAPWNYPFQLAIQPLAYAIAAGNTAIIKPSEMTPHTSAFMSRMISELFPEEEVVVFEGAVETSQALLAKPFNHIFFTGSPRVGKIVMEAAAKHLTSVTLELGGKSPAIVDRGLNLQKVAEKTAWGKCLNGGQTCIAPDYLLIHREEEAAFVKAYRKAVDSFYGEGKEKIKESESFARMVNAGHAERLQELIQDATDQGARVACGGQTDPENCYVAPTLLTGVTTDMKIMQEEIFGPVLPVLTYERQEDILRIVEQNPYPLTAYLNSKRKSMIDWFTDHIRAGGMVINDYLLGFSNPNLPFGGVNNSGIGKSMGYHSFVEFSNEKSIVRRRFGSLKFIFPPYTRGKERIMQLLGKWG